MKTYMAAIVGRAYKVDVDYQADGVFTRGSEASIFDETTGAVTWHGVDTLRYVSGRGALLEGARTNIISNDTETLGSWGGAPGAVITTNTITAPDGDVDADQIDISGINQLVTFPTPGTHNAGDLSLALFALHVANNTSTSTRTFISGGSRFTNFTLTNTWQRIFTEHATVTGDGVFWGGGNFSNSGNFPTPYSMSLWGGQCEESSRFSSSYIRNQTGSALTRSADNLTMPYTPRWNYNYRYAVDVEPVYRTFNSAEYGGEIAQANGRIFSIDANNYIQLNVNNFELVANGVLEINQPLTWGQGDTLTFDINELAGTVTISGATTGNGTFGSGWTAWPSQQTVYVGQDQANANPGFAWITEPYSP